VDAHRDGSVQSTEALADELHRAESDPDYYRELCEACEAVRDRFDPHRERRAWRAILADVGLESSE
ncbi:MAG: hypothetical protein ABEL76_09140, partial [Bradymonadaceae bacterium]